MHRVTTGYLFKVTISTANGSHFSGWFHGPYKVSKVVYGLFLYALQPAKRTSASFMGAILKEYLVKQQFVLWKCEEIKIYESMDEIGSKGMKYELATFII